MARPKGLYPNARALITKRLAGPVQKGAEAFAEQLKTNVSRGSRSGANIPGKGFLRSSPSEYPQEVEGDLVDSVDANPTSNPLRWEAGFFGEPQGKLNALEFGYAPNNLEERAPLQRTADEPETRKAMLDAATKG